MKFGLKLWSTNVDLIDDAVALIDEKIYDYIDLLKITNTEITPFLCGVPYIIHSDHNPGGLDLSDSSRMEQNLRSIDETFDWCDQLNAKYVVFHPDLKIGLNSKRMLDKITDKRALIENMPNFTSKWQKMCGTTPLEIEFLLSKKRLCLDFGHTIHSAKSHSVDYEFLIKEFLKLKPKMFHISDGITNDELDNHMRIGEGDFDFNFIMDCAKKSGVDYMTLETPRYNLELMNEAVEDLNKLK